MGKFILYFKEKAGEPCAIRFVKDYRKRGFLRKERIEYTFDLRQAYDFPELDDVLAASKRIMKDWPGAVVNWPDEEEFKKEFALHKFWVITQRDVNGDPYEFYTGRDKLHQAEFTEDINKASIGLDMQSEADTVGRLRTKGTRIAIDCVYLSLVNDLLNPNFMIICTSRREGQRTRFFARQEDTRLRLVETSDAAKKMPYREAIDTYERLKATNKNFNYAVLPVFKDNVHYKNLEDYVLKTRVSRALKMNLRLSRR